MDESALQKRTTPNSRRTDGESLAFVGKYVQNAVVREPQARATPTRTGTAPAPRIRQLRRHRLTAVSPRRDGALLVYWTHVRVGLRASGYARRSALRLSTEKKKKNARGAGAPLAAAGATSATAPTPGPCIHHPLPLAPARSWFGRSAVPRLRHVAPRRSTRLVSGGRDLSTTSYYALYYPSPCGQCRVLFASSPQTGALSQAPTTQDSKQRGVATGFFC